MITKKQEKLAEDKGWDIEAVKAYIDLGIGDAVKWQDNDLKYFEEAYCGQWVSDEDFVRNLFDDIGIIPKDLPAYIHIDWEWTAKEIMMDYSEENGYYFRNL